MNPSNRLTSLLLFSMVCMIVSPIKAMDNSQQNQGMKKAQPQSRCVKVAPNTCFIPNVGYRRKNDRFLAIPEVVPVQTDSEGPKQHSQIVVNFRNPNQKYPFTSVYVNSKYLGDEVPSEQEEEEEIETGEKNEQTLPYLGAPTVYNYGSSSSTGSSTSVSAAARARASVNRGGMSTLEKGPEEGSIQRPSTKAQGSPFLNNDESMALFDWYKKLNLPKLRVSGMTSTFQEWLNKRKQSAVVNPLRIQPNTYLNRFQSQTRTPEEMNRDQFRNQKRNQFLNEGDEMMKENPRLNYYNKNLPTPSRSYFSAPEKPWMASKGAQQPKVGEEAQAMHQEDQTITDPLEAPVSAFAYKKLKEMYEKEKGKNMQDDQQRYGEGPYPAPGDRFQDYLFSSDKEEEEEEKEEEEKEEEKKKAEKAMPRFAHFPSKKDDQESDDMTPSKPNYPHKMLKKAQLEARKRERQAQEQESKDEMQTRLGYAKGQPVQGNPRLSIYQKEVNPQPVEIKPTADQSKEEEKPAQPLLVPSVQSTEVVTKDTTVPKPGQVHNSVNVNIGPISVAAAAEKANNDIKSDITNMGGMEIKNPGNTNEMKPIQPIQPAQAAQPVQPIQSIVSPSVAEDPNQKHNINININNNNNNNNNHHQPPSFIGFQPAWPVFPAYPAPLPIYQPLNAPRFIYPANVVPLQPLVRV